MLKWCRVEYQVSYLPATSGPHDFLTFPNYYAFFREVRLSAKVHVGESIGSQVYWGGVSVSFCFYLFSMLAWAA